MSEIALSVPAAFTAFDGAISLDPHQRTQAERRHGEITDVLMRAGLAAGTFLQGSFARKTMRRPLKDVDMVVMLEDGIWSALLDQFGPGKALELFKQPLRNAFRGVGIEFDVHDKPAKALQVVFGDCDFTFDLVAGRPAAGEDVLIANRETSQWELTNTRTLKRLVAERNVATGGVFVHQVRMVKEFRAQHPELDPVCGLVSESLTFRAVTRRMAHAEAVAATLRYGATALLAPVMDPTGVDDLSAKWTSEDRVTFAGLFDVAARGAEEALRLQGAGDQRGALAVWRSVLGPEFTPPPAQGANDALQAMAAGSVTSAGWVSSTRAGAAPTRPTRSWRSS